MNWKADHFFESRTAGFIAAVNVYNTEQGEVPVVFQDKHIFLLIDPDEGIPATVKEIQNALKECLEESLEVSDAFEDCYVELGFESVDEEDIAMSYGLTDEDIQDINKRIQDLSGYWVIVEDTF